MFTHDKNMKVFMVAAIYVAVALIVTSAFVLRGNNVMAATNATNDRKNVAEVQQITLDQRYVRLTQLATEIIDKDVAQDMLDEALGIADHYLCEELDDTNTRQAIRAVLKDTAERGLQMVLKTRAPDTLQIHSGDSS